jgi:hypothetical protein
MGFFLLACTNNPAIQEEREIRSIIDKNKKEAQRVQEEFRNLKRQRRS